MVIRGEFLEAIKQKSVFLDLVHVFFAEKSAEMDVHLHWNRGRALDAYFQWMQDLDRIELVEEKVTKADAFKRAAHLIYWLRRSSPVDNFVSEVPEEIDPDGHLKFMFEYGREYLAFNLGYQALLAYEMNVDDRQLSPDSFSLQSSLPDVPEHDFMYSACHVLKLKNVSPHAIYLVLKALLLRP